MRWCVYTQGLKTVRSLGVVFAPDGVAAVSIARARGFLCNGYTAALWVRRADLPKPKPRARRDFIDRTSKRLGLWGGHKRRKQEGEANEDSDIE